MKKSQIQMMETITILLIFFILVGIGLIFFMRIMKAGAEDKIDKFQELSKIQTAQIASSLPELQCSQDNIMKSNCLDILKLQVGLNIISQNANNYFDLFGYSKISVQRLYPLPGNWDLYDRKPNNIQSKSPVYFPISLYDPYDDNYYFGIMTIEVYT